MESKFLKRASILFVSLFFSEGFCLKIEIKRGQVAPDNIAVVDFYDQNGSKSETGASICSIIKNDLSLSGLFIPMDPGSFIEGPKQLLKGPNVKNWSILNARFLLHGKIITKSSNEFDIKFILVDVVTGEVMLSMNTPGTKQKLRSTAHTIADYVYERITNEQGYFGTQIIFVETINPHQSSKRKTRIVKIDQDGENREVLIDKRELTLTPRYSNDGQTITYILYHDTAEGPYGKSAQIYVMDMHSKLTRTLLSQSQTNLLIKQNSGNPIQMAHAPRFSNDGKNAVFAVIIEGKSAIFKLNRQSNELSQLTPLQLINTSPCFSNDDQQIVFTSNRDGKEAIYIMEIDGSNVRKISREEGKYSQPVWSPRGDLIAFAKQIRGEFLIGVMKPDGSCERIIYRGYMVEAPCWSSNGRYIIFTEEPGPGRPSRIVIVDLTGLHVRAIRTPGDASGPTWSPFLVSLKDVRK
jgi:TolB protein